MSALDWLPGLRHALPRLSEWRTWGRRDYLLYFLSSEAARRRLQGAAPPSEVLSPCDFAEFCAPIKAELGRGFSSPEPAISVVVAAHNEERELLATLVSYTCLELGGVGAEIVVVDNASQDRTAQTIKACGVHYVHCAQRGVGYAKKAGVDGSNQSSRYVWLTDGDARVVPPLESEADIGRRSTVLRTSFECLERDPRILGVSTGGAIESAHWSYRAIHRLAVGLGRTSEFSCWSGVNQFIRRDALAAIGGVDPSIQFWEDQNRHFQLARYAKSIGALVESGNQTPSLLDPVYSSGRRYSSLRLVGRQLLETLTRSPLTRDENGYPIHPRNVDWRRIRPEVAEDPKEGTEPDR